MKLMLSSILAIFCGLQDSLQKTISSLPPNTPPKLKIGLVKVHLKLSTYYSKTDSSPYYVWVCCEHFKVLSSANFTKISN